MKTVILSLLVLLTLAFAAGAWFYYFDTYHFAVVQPGVLYRDGFQGMRRFVNAYRQRPFKSVIDLQSDADLIQYKDSLAEQRAFCKEHGIVQYRIAMKQKTPPTPEQIEQFLKIVRDPANQPVLAHDSQGVIREGMMVAVWQKEGMGYDYEKALESVRLFGHSDTAELFEFIKRLYNKQ